MKKQEILECRISSCGNVYLSRVSYNRIDSTVCPECEYQAVKRSREHTPRIKELTS